ncbi:hypothetical protein TNCV_1650121 [Trichonephila clavipes]|nr:hypothetical protein TNCV_1650121 [Trichonephila clavipes]
MNRVVLTEYNGDQMTREMRGRHNKEGQFDQEKAEKGTIVHNQGANKIKQQECQRMRRSTTARPGKERNVYKEILVTGGLGRKRQLQVIRTSPSQHGASVETGHKSVNPPHHVDMPKDSKSPSDIQKKKEEAGQRIPPMWLIE